MKISADTVTINGIEAIRQAAYKAYAESCRVLAGVSNGILTSEQAETELRDLLAPLQIEPEGKP